MPSLRCLISALTQAGGGDLLLRFASSIQSCCGEGGMLQAEVAVCGEHSPCSGQAACSFGGLSQVLCAFSLRGKRFGRPEVCARSPRVRRAFSLRGERPGQPGVWRPLHGRAAPFPSAVSGPGSQRLGALSTGTPRPLPPRPRGSQEVFRQDPGPVCRVGGGGFSGAEFAPCPSPCLLPPVGMGRLFSGVSQSLCFANRRWCAPAGQFFSRSPAV